MRVRLQNKLKPNTGTSIGSGTDIVRPKLYWIVFGTVHINTSFRFLIILSDYSIDQCMHQKSRTVCAILLTQRKPHHGVEKVFQIGREISMQNVQPAERETERSRLSCFWQDAFHDLTDLKLDVQTVMKEIYATYIVITEILCGLIWSIEHNFPRRYLRSRPPEVMAHKSPLEADMSCYETYENAIKKMMEIYAKVYCEYEN